MNLNALNIVLEGTCTVPLKRMSLFGIVDEEVGERTAWWGRKEGIIEHDFLMAISWL